MSSVINPPLWQPASDAVKFVAKLSLEISKADERRAERRVPIAVPISIQPLNENLSPTGDDISGITRDMSRSGIGVFHSAPVDSEFVQVVATSTTGDVVSAVGRMIYSNKVGPFNLSGIEFLFGIEED